MCVFTNRTARLQKEKTSKANQHRTKVHDDYNLHTEAETKQKQKLRARDPGERTEVSVEGKGNGGAKGPKRRSARAHGRPGGGAHTKGRGLSASKANSCAMLKEERATTLTQFLVTRLVIQGGEDGRCAGEPRCKEDARIHCGDGQMST